MESPKVTNPDTQHSQSDTICAISTPPGVGGIAVARISGPQAFDVVAKIWRGKSLRSAVSHTAHLGNVYDCDGNQLDQAVATVYRAPHSFTGDDVVEVAVHGSTYVQSSLINALIASGARLAEPGEFTRRAFASGKMDLAQAEAVADVIASTDQAAHRIAINQMRGAYSARLGSLRDKLLELASLLELELDFSEEDVEFASRDTLRKLAIEIQSEVSRLAESFKAGSAIKNGIPVAIVGATNAGKSSLLNALLGDDRAIVSDIHGTTRDVVEDRLHIGGYTFRIMDTAGLRHTDDTIEKLGIERSLKALQSADIVIHVIDALNPQDEEIPDFEGTLIKVYNKCDLVKGGMLTVDGAKTKDKGGKDNTTAYTYSVSALTGEGVDDVRNALAQAAADSEGGADSVLVTNARHYQALILAHESITRALDAIDNSLSGDLIAIDIRLTIDHLNSILGEISSTEILASIFSRFCIGK